MNKTLHPTQGLRHCWFLIAMGLLAGWGQASVVRGDMISAVTGNSTVDPSDPRFLLTPLYVSFTFGGTTTPLLDFSIRNVIPTALPGQTLTFTQDPSFTAGLSSIARAGTANVFNVLMGTFRQTPTTMANPPSTIEGSVVLSVTYYGRPTTELVARYNLQVTAVPEPSSIVSGMIAVLGVGGLAMCRRGLRKAA